MTETQIHDRLQAVDALRRIAHMARLSGWDVNDFDIDGLRGLTPQIVIRHDSYCGGWYRIEDGDGEIDVMRASGPDDWEYVGARAYHDPEGALLAAYRDAVYLYASTYGQERP